MLLKRKNKAKFLKNKTREKSKSLKNNGKGKSKFKGKELKQRKPSVSLNDEHLDGQVTDDNINKVNDCDLLLNETSDIEEVYEKLPRMRKELTVRNLLPVKTKQGLIFRSEVVNEEGAEEVETVSEEHEKLKAKKVSLVQSYVAQKETLQSLKRKVALLCTSLIEDPENNMSALKELINMLVNSTTDMIVSEKKILCISLLHVFLDILPGYRIRSQEEETKVILKKETKKLLSYEKDLLRYYKKYLDHLNDLIRAMKSKKGLKEMSEVRQKALHEIGVVSVKCMGELLHSRLNFNYFKNIANKLIPLVFECNEEIVDLCCQAFEKLFKSDKLGESSFDVVKQIVNVIKEKNFCVPPALLKTFLSLNLREAKPEIEKINMKKGREEWRMMSRTERRNKKRIKGLEAELKEALAHESVENVQKFHTQTLNKIFWVFFHIIKDGQKMSLIAPSLEGLSKFAHLINLEFYSDLNTVLCALMESGKLSNVEKLHGCYTLFTILAGQAETLHVDPYRIYCHMYQSILHLNQYSNLDHFTLILKCLEFNVLRKRKKISFSRILAFMKRVSTVSLQTPVHGTLGLLSAMRDLILNVKGSDILLDSESVFGSGIYYPEMEDPEYCNAQSSALWELHLLKKHFCPVIKLYSHYLLHCCPNQGKLSLPDKLAKSSPEEILNLFAEVAVNNKFDFLEDAEGPPKKKFKSENCTENFSYENSVDLDLKWTNVKNVIFL